MNMVSPPKAGIASRTAKHKSSAPPIHKTPVKAVQKSPSLSTPLKQLVKSQVVQPFRIGQKQFANRQKPASQPKTINRQKVTVAASINRTEAAATSKMSTLETKTQTAIKATNPRDYASASSSIARKKSSFSVEAAKYPSHETLNRQKAFLSKSVTQRIENAIITETQTNNFLVNKLAKQDYTQQESPEKTSVLVAESKSETNQYVYRQTENHPDEKAAVSIEQGQPTAKSLSALELTRQKMAPQGIKHALDTAASAEEDIVSNVLPTEPHSTKMARQFNSAASASDHFGSSSINDKIGAGENSITPATEEQGQPGSLMSDANHRSSAGAQEQVTAASVKKEYKNSLYTLGASNGLSKKPTAPSSRISKLTTSIFLDIDQQSGADQPITVEAPNYSVQGRVTPGVKQLFLKVNEKLTSVKMDQGSFQAEAALEEGLNQVEMLAFSSSGQISKQTFSIVYVPPTIQLERQYKPSAWTTYINDEFSTNSYVHTIALDKYKNKWFGMNTGAVKYSGSRWTSYTSEDGLVSDMVYAIVSDQKGHLWFGTQGGVSHFDRLQWKNYTTRDGLVHNQVNAMVVDKQGNIWCGTQGGVSRFDGAKWISYTTRDGLISNQINAMAVDAQGNLWFGTDDGVSRFDGAKWVSYTTRDGLVSNLVNSVAVDEQDRLWFGTNDGVSRFDGAKWISYTTRDGLVSNLVNSVAVDEQDRLWFGTNDGVSRFDGERWLNFNKQDGLSSDNIYAVLVESNHSKWFGTDIGISELNEETNKRVYR